MYRSKKILCKTTTMLLSLWMNVFALPCPHESRYIPTLFDELWFTVTDFYKEDDDVEVVPSPSPGPSLSSLLTRGFRVDALSPQYVTLSLPESSPVPTVPLDRWMAV